MSWQINPFTGQPEKVANSPLAMLRAWQRHMWFYDHFVAGSTAGNLGWSPIGANSGTIAVTTANALNPGLIRLGTATSSNAQSALRLGVSQILLGSARTMFCWKFTLSALSIVTEEYAGRWGLLDSTTGDAVDGVYAAYDRVNDGDFLSFRTYANSSGTKTIFNGLLGETSFPIVAGTFYNLLFDVNAAANTADLYACAQGSAPVFLKRHTTNIPSGAGRQTSPCASLIKSAGTGVTINCDLDLFWMYMNFSSLG